MVSLLPLLSLLVRLQIPIQGHVSHAVQTPNPVIPTLISRPRPISMSYHISRVCRPGGLLLHRGYRIEDLAANCSYLEVAYLLLNGNLPTRAHLEEFTSSVLSMMMLHEKLRSFFMGFKDGAHPMAIMVHLPACLLSTCKDGSWSLAIDLSKPGLSALQHIYSAHSANILCPPTHPLTQHTQTRTWAITWASLCNSTNHTQTRTRTHTSWSWSRSRPGPFPPATPSPPPQA